MFEPPVLPGAPSLPPQGIPPTPPLAATLPSAPRTPDLRIKPPPFPPRPPSPGTPAPSASPLFSSLPPDAPSRSLVTILSADYSQISKSPGSMDQFKTAFVSALASALKIPQSQVGEGPNIIFHIIQLIFPSKILFSPSLKQVEIVGTPQPGSIIVSSKVYASSAADLPALDAALASLTSSPKAAINQSFLSAYAIDAVFVELLDTSQSDGDAPNSILVRRRGPLTTDLIGTLLLSPHMPMMQYSDWWASSIPFCPCSHLRRHP